MRHGGYIAKQDLLYGDAEYAVQSKELYDALGLNRKFAQHFDGVSIFMIHSWSEGLIRRFCITNFFDPKFKVTVQDL